MGPTAHLRCASPWELLIQQEWIETRWRRARGVWRSGRERCDFFVNRWQIPWNGTFLVGNSSWNDVGAEINWGRLIRLYVGVWWWWTTCGFKMCFSFPARSRHRSITLYTFMTVVSGFCLVAIHEQFEMRWVSEGWKISVRHLESTTLWREYNVISRPHPTWAVCLTSPGAYCWSGLGCGAARGGVYPRAAGRIDASTRGRCERSTPGRSRVEAGSSRNEGGFEPGAVRGQR